MPIFPPPRLERFESALTLAGGVVTNGLTGQAFEVVPGTKVSVQLACKASPILRNSTIVAFASTMRTMADLVFVDNPVVTGVTGVYTAGNGTYTLAADVPLTANGLMVYDVFLPFITFVMTAGTPTAVGYFAAHLSASR
jgi:hypothetical protein